MVLSPITFVASARLSNFRFGDSPLRHNDPSRGPLTQRTLRLKVCAVSLSHTARDPQAKVADRDHRRVTPCHSLPKIRALHLFHPTPGVRDFVHASTPSS